MVFSFFSQFLRPCFPAASNSSWKFIGFMISDCGTVLKRARKNSPGIIHRFNPLTCGHFMARCCK